MPFLVFMLQPTPRGQTARQYAAIRFVDGGERRLRKVQTGLCTVSNRVLYKELKEGACKIVDGNMILLA